MVPRHEREEGGIRPLVPVEVVRRAILEAARGAPAVEGAVAVHVVDRDVHGEVVQRLGGVHVPFEERPVARPRGLGDVARELRHPLGRGALVRLQRRGVVGPALARPGLLVEVAVAAVFVLPARLREPPVDRLDHPVEPEGAPVDRDHRVRRARRVDPRFAEHAVGEAVAQQALVAAERVEVQLLQAVQADRGVVAVEIDLERHPPADVLSALEAVEERAVGALVAEPDLAHFGGIDLQARRDVDLLGRVRVQPLPRGVGDRELEPGDAPLREELRRLVARRDGVRLPALPRRGGGVEQRTARQSGGQGDEGKEPHAPNLNPRGGPRKRKRPSRRGRPFSSGCRGRTSDTWIMIPLLYQLS